MPRAIVKLADDEYVEWSTVCDAPITYIKTRSEMLEYLLAEYGRDNFARQKQRVADADKYGTSTRESARQYVAHNRAGPEEKCISLESIRERYSPGVERGRE